MSGRKLYVKLGDWFDESDLKIGRDALYRSLQNFGMQLRRKKGRKRTTDSAHSLRKYPDLAKDFVPTGIEQLQVADLTYLRTESGFVYLSLITDAWSKKIVGWKTAGSMEALHTLDALFMLLKIKLLNDRNTIHHSDRGVQYLSISYTERLVEAGIEPSVGSVGDSYDNAMAETIIGLYKTEVIRRQGPWKNLDDVEYATLEWVDWFNHRRILEPIGNIPPAEKEANHYRQTHPAEPARHTQPSLH